jgi:hypothetical protein
MAYLYSLYDALVSISVPSDKARAVVDAMERDMVTTLATKQDLEVHRLATKQDVELLRQEMHGSFREMRQEMDARFKEAKQDMDSRFKDLKQDMDARFNEMKQAAEAQSLKMTVRFGYMLFLGLGLTVAALGLWIG